MVRFKYPAIALVLAGLMRAPLATAQPDQPRIVSSPSIADFARYYPDRAQRFEIEGKAALACMADDAGTLQNCTVTHEWPLDFGFGPAALKLAQGFRVSHAGLFRTTINFRLGDQEDHLYVIGPSGGKLVRILGKPSLAEIAAVYPGVGAEVLTVGLQCRLTAEVRLADCEAAASAHPPSSAAIEAAKRLVNLYRLAPIGGELVGARTTIYINLVPPDPDSPPAPGARQATR